ncbi:ATP synthase subunit s, mitochondrial-like isoform X2 [Homarus americanus]|uniref:ATP synthase subunit s, mitochondrial-like isoform X2 n=1 Tax=Homarus americanus TaxID=6706 RepID=UPI001C453BE2|nr:ATP synthase subunit s, mitochondrial-like isoform X2 [Homarus americanus]
MMSVRKDVTHMMVRYIKYRQLFTTSWQQKMPKVIDKIVLTSTADDFGLLSVQEKHSPCISCLSPSRSSFVQLWSLTPQRNLWGWLNAIFNKVDESRIKDVGPDRACAEWLLRCGAFVKWQNSENWTKDYNTLPATGGRFLKIEEIDATDSAIMHIGFPHFRGCKHIRRIVFHKASYLDDLGLSQLLLLQNSLKELQISSCGNVTSDGLRNLKKLDNRFWMSK